jgi:hypothetical protein
MSSRAWRARARRWRLRQADALAVWLCKHEHPGLALLVWKASGAL